MRGMVSFICVMLLLTAVGCKRKVQVTVPDDAPFRNGDIVFRRGYGAQSRAVANASRSVWSHTGVLVRDTVADIWTVVHAVPGEAPQGEPDYVKQEPLKVFFGHDRAQAGAWLRVNCTDSMASRAAEYAIGKAAEHVQFDNDYLLSDTTSLYCTELVWRSYLSVGIDITDGNRHYVPQMFSADGEGIYPADIENSKTTLFINIFNNNP